ncbi:hypothetical protein NL108_016732 [Boleophthalmus pectinirostris]|nr:hypothetical protein NL108_016732 [Boleophthalmus pectinirostris]
MTDTKAALTVLHFGSDSFVPVHKVELFFYSFSVKYTARRKFSLSTGNKLVWLKTFLGSSKLLLQFWSDAGGDPKWAFNKTKRTKKQDNRESEPRRKGGTVPYTAGVSEKTTEDFQTT